MLASAAVQVQGASTTPQVPDDLFRLDRVWEVDLNFARDQWRALQPIEPEGFNFPGGGPGSGRPGGGGMRFGPGLFLGPPVFKAADANADGQVTREEFEQLGERWFEKWDTDHTGQLDEPKLRAGFATVMTQPNGGPGGPGGFSLQGQEGKRNGLSSARGIEFNYVHADLTFNGVSLPDVAVRYKGNGTYMQSARQLKRLGAGMPVDVYVLSEAQSIIAYISKPVVEQAQRAFR